MASDELNRDHEPLGIRCWPPGRRCDRVDARSLIQGVAEYRADEAVRSIVRGQDGVWKRKRHEAEGIWWDARRRPQSPIGRDSFQNMFREECGGEGKMGLKGGEELVHDKAIFSISFSLFRNNVLSTIQCTI